MNEKQKNIKIIMKIVVIILILLILMVVAYSWFYTVVLGNETVKTINLKGAKLEITYVDGPALNETDIIPGDTISKTFNIENTGNTVATYKIAWKTLENNFVNRADFVYNVASTNGGGTLNQTQLPNSGENILMMDNIAIAPGVTQSYTVTIQYVRTEYNQISDKGKTLIGIIEALDAEDTTPEAEPATGSITEIMEETLYGMTKNELLDKIYPVGSIYTSLSNNPSPESMFGGTWVRIKDTFLLAAGNTYAADDGTHTTATAGSADAVVVSHTHTQAAHSHLIYEHDSAGSTWGINTIKATHYWAGGMVLAAQPEIYPTGVSGIGKNMPPYLTVYMWKRIE